jgi:GntR family transcriptional regulator
MALDVSPVDAVSRFHRLRLADGQPMAIEYAAIPARYLESADLVGESLYQALNERGLVPCRGLQRLHATQLSDERAALLKVPAGSAALYIERLTFLESGAPIEFTRSYYRGDAYDFIAELTMTRLAP